MWTPDASLFNYILGICINDVNADKLSYKDFKERKWKKASLNCKCIISNR